MPRLKFDHLSKAEQRVVIAKDLIKRLDAHKFVARHGTYFSVPLRPQDIKDVTAEIRTILEGKKCKGCQIGGMFLCAVDRYNKLTLDDVDYLEDNENAMRWYLTQWFSPEQLLEVEAAFEGWEGHGLDYGDWKAGQPAERMRAIARNIIRNKGSFVGSQLLNSVARSTRG